MFVFNSIERLSLIEQNKFQWEKIEGLLAYLNQHSPYYKRLFQNNKIAIKDIKSFEDFARLPVTEKKDIQQYNDDFLCVSRDDIAELTTTSGTLGRPVHIALSHSDLKRLAYNEFLSFSAMGLKATDTVQLLLTLDKQFMAGIAYYNGLQKIGATVIRSGPGQVSKQWELIQQFNTTTLVAVPSFILKMLDDAPNTIPKSLKNILAIGEVIRDENNLPNAMAQRIRSELKVNLFGTYASTEMQTAFTECSLGKGGHLQPELIYIELLDEQNKPVVTGEEGELTISTLGVTGMPLLRYKTGDIFKIYKDSCLCGRKTPRLSALLGRKNQMIKYKGTTFYPPALDNLLHQIDLIKEYGLRIEKDNWGQDIITLLVLIEGEKDNVIQKIREVCRQKLRVVPEIRTITATDMQAFLFPKNSRKPMRIQDFRNG